MLDGQVLGASQVEYKPFGKPPLKREAALPQGLALLAERFHRRPALLLALLGHGGSCALAKLKLQVLRPLQHLLPVLDVDLLRREPAGELSAAPARALPERARRAGGLPPPERLPASAPRHQRRPSAQASAARGAPGRGWPY